MRIKCYSEPQNGKSGFYELEGVVCTTPSGSGDEWLAVYNGLLQGRPVSFRRVQLTVECDDFFGISCPRNAYSGDDYDLIGRTHEASSLAAQIIQCLKEHGDPALFREYDPIALGA